MFTLFDCRFVGLQDCGYGKCHNVICDLISLLGTHINSQACWTQYSRYYDDGKLFYSFHISDLFPSSIGVKSTSKDTCFIIL